MPHPSHHIVIASQRVGALAPPDDRLREAIHSAACRGMDCFRLRPLGYGGQVVAVAPLRKRFAFVAGNDDMRTPPVLGIYFRSR